MSTRHSADPNPHIVFIGNPADGFYAVGPFDTQDDAVRYIGGEHHKENCWAMELCAPASDEGEPTRLGDEIVEQERSMEAANAGAERLKQPTAVEVYAGWLTRQPKPKTMAEALAQLPPGVTGFMMDPDKPEVVHNAVAEAVGEAPLKRSDLSKVVQLQAALTSLMGCFNDEIALVERFPDQLSIAWEECEKAMKETALSVIVSP